MVGTWLDTKMAQHMTVTTKNFISDLFDAYVEDGIRLIITN